MRLRHAVRPIKHHLPDPAQKIEQRDAGIGNVMIDPSLGIDLLAHEREELFEAPVVQIDVRERHRQTPAILIWCEPEATSSLSPSANTALSGRSRNFASTT